MTVLRTGGAPSTIRLAALTAVLAGVQLLAVLDGLAASLALPQIGSDLGLGAGGEAWVLNVTSVALVGGLLVAGRLGDLMGRRRVFLVGTALLGVGSTVAAIAPDAAVLLGGRGVIGLGAALAYPSALALTSSLFPGEPWRTRAFAVSAVSGASGALAGAVYGGVVTDLLGWRWVFWLTVPVTVLLLAAALIVLPADRARTRSRPLDLPGVLLATTAVTALVAAIIGLGTASLEPAPAGALIALVAAVSVVLVRHERRAHDPLLPSIVVRSRRLLGGCAGIAANSALWSVVVFVLAQDLQGAGWSAAEAGLAVLPCSAGILVGGVVVVPWLRRRAGSVRTTVVGLAAGAVGALGLAADAGQPSFAGVLVPALGVLGFGLAAAATGIKEHTLKDGPQGAEATSAAVLESSTHVGGAVSVALYAAVLAMDVVAPAYLMAAAIGLAGAVGVANLQGLRGGPAVSAPP